MSTFAYITKNLPRCWGIGPSSLFPFLSPTSCHPDLWLWGLGGGSLPTQLVDVLRGPRGRRGVGGSPLWVRNGQDESPLWPCEQEPGHKHREKVKVKTLISAQVPCSPR